jgi:hypothetical protein
VVLGLRARGASLSSGWLVERLDREEVGVAWAAAGTLCAERTLVILRLGGAGSERGHTIKASVGFIGTGSSVARGRAPGRALALPGQVEHVFVSFCTSSRAC